MLFEIDRGLHYGYYDEEELQKLRLKIDLTERNNEINFFEYMSLEDEIENYIAEIYRLENYSDEDEDDD